MYNRAGTGSASLTVHGAGLGLMVLTGSGRSGHTRCEGTEWESETSVRCLMGHGARGTRRVAMTAGERSGSMSEGYSVDGGSMSVMRRENRAGTGSASVTVHGSSLGLVAYTGMVRSGETGCEGTEWESETSVRCLVGRGARGTRRVAMTAGERAGTGSTAVSMDVGDMSVMRRENRAGTGSASVTVHGSSLGLVAYTARVRVGHTRCEETEWESETSLRCMSSSGVRGSRRVVLTACERSRSLTAGWSIDAVAMFVGAASMTAGREFRALEFPGGSTSDRAQRGLMLFFPSTSITVELWVRKDPANPGALLAILGCKSQTGSSRELVLWASETQVFLEIKAQKAYGAFCPLSVGVWAHYAFTWDNTQGTVECTKDGTFQNRQNNVATDLSFDSQISMMIGQDYENTLTPASSFAGGLSQLRIWNTDVSHHQI